MNPLCPICKKEMEKRKATNGEHWYCPDYAYCGGMRNIKDGEA